MLQRILNIIGWIGTALVVAAVAMRLMAPQYDRYAIWMAWAGLACVLLYPLGQWRQIATSLNRRQSKYATITFTSIIVVLGILIAANYLSNRRFKRWDLTTNLVNSLSEQSLKVVGDLKAPLKLVVVDLAQDLERHRGRLTMYDNASDQLSVEFFDPEKDPVRAEKYEITTVPTIVLEYMGRTEKVTTIEEREITSAIIRAVTGQARKVYFVQGHGERDSASGDRDGYLGIAQLMKGDNITTETLALTQHKEVPDDASVVALLGPTVDLLDEEVEQLKRYLAKGGRLLVLVEPTIEKRDQPLTKLTALVGEWGIEIGNNVVLDASGRANTPTAVVAQPPYPSNPITQDFRNATLFVVARSVTPAAKAPEGRTAQMLVQSAPEAWAESDIAGLLAGTAPEPNPDKGDKAGPVTVAAIASSAAPPVEPKEGATAPPQTRVAVFGDADFADNTYFRQLGNGELLLNTVSWLTAQENLIAIRPREPLETRMEMTPNQSTAVGWFALGIVPLLVFGAGVVSWARRRSS